MKRSATHALSLALLSAGITIGSFGCSNGPKGTETTEVLETADGAIIVETFSITATVAAVDRTNRKVTLTSPDGGKRTYKVSSKMDLAQIKVGDTVTVEATEELALALNQDGATPSAGIGDAVAIVTAKNQADVLVADTAEVTVIVAGVDRKHREVMLQFPDGSARTVKVGKNIDLFNVDIGDAVIVQVAESLAIELKRS